MRPGTIVVLLFSTDDEPCAPDETAEFTFAQPAKDYARKEVDEGRARKAVVRNRDGDVILRYPQ